MSEQTTQTEQTHAHALTPGELVDQLLRQLMNVVAHYMEKHDVMPGDAHLALIMAADELKATARAALDAGPGGGDDPRENT